MIRSALNIVSPSGLNGNLSIFIFHRVSELPDPLFPSEPDSVHFNKMMGWIKSWFNVLPLDLAVEALRSGKLPARAAAITFDDGYADNKIVALPILQKHGLSATFFIATGFLDGGRMWNDSVIEAIRHAEGKVLNLSSLNLGSHPIGSIPEKRTSISKILSEIKYLSITERAFFSENIAEIAGINLPSNLMMTSGQVKEIKSCGMQIGAHTVSHPILAKLDTQHARDEIYESKEFLEGLLGEKIILFAYPNGKLGKDYLEEHAIFAKSIGFTAAVSTNPSIANARSDLYQLPRFTPWDKSKLKFGFRMLAKNNTVNLRG